MAEIFKAYDIRGLYGTDLTEQTAADIGRGFVTFTRCRTVVVGYDIRSHSKPLFEALAKGLTEMGADVVALGLCSTPISYFANGLLQTDAGIMITASHNPPEWNGFKLCRENAIPISGATGIQDIKAICENKAFEPVAGQPGTVSERDVTAEYVAHVRKLADLKRPIRIAADFANAMGIFEMKALDGLVEIDPLFDELDGSCPNHEANPLKAETLETLQARMREGGYDFGAAFDGDSDRVGFVDEAGEIIPMDIMTALIARSILEHRKGTILYDLRSSWSVKEVIEENGGTPVMCRVGHAFIKQQMRDCDALYAGELSGHYYFQQNYFTESAAMAVLSVANLLSHSDAALSELIRPLQRYCATGEINLEVAAAEPLFAKLREKYADGNIIELDGLSIEYEDWWFNLRASNTEPLVRLNLEAKTPDTREQRKRELLALIGE